MLCTGFWQRLWQLEMVSSRSQERHFVYLPERRSEILAPCTGDMHGHNAVGVFIMRKHRRLPPYLSVEEWIPKLWCVRMKEYYRAGKGGA